MISHYVALYQISEQNSYEKNSFKDLDHGEMLLREFIQVNSQQCLTYS